MSAMLQGTPEVLGAYKQYKEFSADPVIRERVRVRQRFLDEQEIRLGDAWEGGMAKGRAKEKVETAINLKRLGVLPTTIAEATGLSISEIERLN